MTNRIDRRQTDMTTKVIEIKTDMTKRLDGQI